MWLIIGLLVAFLGWRHMNHLKRKRINLKYYEWFLGISGFLLLIFTAHDVPASFAEHNEIAGWTFLWLTGMPASILLLLAWLLPWRRARRL